jgi:DNA-binding NtrC family response regulator
MMTLPTVVIVDQDQDVLANLRSIAEDAGYWVGAHTRFDSARGELHAGYPVSALVVNLKLGEFNGIHLVYLARLHHANIRSLVYSRSHDAILALEAQHASAFYERQGFLPFSLRAFLTAGLPASDRRGVRGIDRRTTFRGGRRTTDVADLYFGDAV